jgi:hypothetical protein
MISIRLPLPPSVNGLYGTNRRTGGRYKTKKYQKWEREACGELHCQWRHLRQFIPVTGEPIVSLG